MLSDSKVCIHCRIARPFLLICYTSQWKVSIHYQVTSFTIDLLCQSMESEYSLTSGASFTVDLLYQSIESEHLLLSGVSFTVLICYTS